MAKVGDKTHTAHGLGTITEVDTVRGRTQYRVAGAGFNVWLDETKIHVANDGLFAFRPMDEYAEEARNAPQDDLGIEHWAGLDATIEPGSTPVNENNHTTLPYDYTPQYHHDVWADEQTIQPGQQEIDPDDRLKATDSVSGERRDERPYPGPNPDLFAKSARSAEDIYHEDALAHDGIDFRDLPEGPFARSDYEELPRRWNHEGDHRWDAGTAPDGFHHHVSARHRVEDFRGPISPGEDAGIARNPYTGDTETGRFEGDPEGHGHWDKHANEHGGYEWAEGYTPDERDIRDRAKLKHPESGTLEPGESWGHLPNDEALDYMDAHNAEATYHLEHDPYDAPYFPEGEPHHGSYRPAGLSDRYAHFELEATDNDSKVAQFRRDPVGFIELCGHLWTDGDDSLEKFADYTGLIDVDPTMREAAWSDVRQKAQRLRREGRVHVNDMGENRIYATVEGDHGTYDTMIAKGGSMGGFGGGQSITNWACSCDWGKWAFKRQMTYVGRLCSHGYATYLTMQSDYTKANPITQKQPYKKKWAAADRHPYGFDEDKDFWADPYGINGPPQSVGYQRWLADNGLEGAPFKDRYNDYAEQQFQWQKHHQATRTAGIVDDYKSWLEDNDQNPEAASVAAFLSTVGDENPEDAEKLYDYISGNHDEAPERDFDTDYVTQPEDAYKTADLLRTTPRSLTPDLRAVPEGEGEQWVDVTKDDRETTGPDQIVKDAAWVDATLRALHGVAGQGITDFALPNSPASGGAGGSGDGGGGGTINDPLNPDAPVGTPAPSGGSSGNDEGKINDPLKTSSRRFAESSDAALLDKLRELSTTPAAEDLGHMDDHNDELRDVVDELQDRGYDASFMVAAVEDSASDGKGDFAGKSVADWANEPFAGSGPAPKDWFSDSAGYVDENERDRFIDVTDAPDGDIIKFNDSRSAPQQGPRKSSSRRTSSGAGLDQFLKWCQDTQHGVASGTEAAAWIKHHGIEGTDLAHDIEDYVDSQAGYDGMGQPSDPDDPYFTEPSDLTPKESSRRRADNFSPNSGVTSSDPGMNGASSMGTPPETPSEPFDVSQTLASLHVAEMPNANDWDNASGDPFMEELGQDLGGDDSEDSKGGDDDSGGDSGGGGGGLGAALPGLMKGLGGGGGAAAGAAGAAGGGAAASELAGLAVLAGQGVRRAGRGATSQVRVDPGTRQPNRPRQAMSPPDDFGYSGGEIHMAAPEDNGDDIVAAFQRSAGAAAVMGNAPSGGDDIADRALAFLRTAGRKYSPAEQRELEAEHHPLGARNLPTEDELSGTHYVLGM